MPALDALVVAGQRGGQGEPDVAPGAVPAGRAPPGRWGLYAVVQAGPVQKVKRAAPGGQGNVLDPYSVAALDKYLAGFDRAFAGFRGPMPRGHFHDSFEYYGANWTTDFFREFR